MASGFASCEKQESVSDAVASAVEKTNELDSFEAEITMEIAMAMEGMTMTVPMTVDMKAENANGEKPIFSATMSTSLLGMAVEADLYCDGEWVYYSGDGMEYKMPAEESGDEYDYTGDIDAMLKDIPGELFKDKQFAKNDDGSSTVIIDVPNEVFAEIYDELIDSMNEESTDEAVGDVEISDAKISITIKDGYISVYDISFKMSMTTYDVESTSEVKTSVTFKNPGEKVTVTPMEGYQDFEEYDPYAAFEGLGDLGDFEDFEDFEDYDIFEGLEGLEDFGDFGDFGEFDDYDVFAELEGLGDLEGLEF